MNSAAEGSTGSSTTGLGGWKEDPLFRMAPWFRSWAWLGDQTAPIAKAGGYVSHSVPDNQLILSYPAFKWVLGLVCRSSVLTQQTSDLRDPLS